MQGSASEAESIGRQTHQADFPLNLEDFQQCRHLRTGRNQWDASTPYSLQPGEPLSEVPLRNTCSQKAIHPV